MGWLGESVKKGVVSGVVAIATKWLLGAVITIALVWVGELLASLLGVPLWGRLVAGFIVVGLIFRAVWVFLQGARPTEMTSRYWAWFKLPFARTSWEFVQYLAVGGSANGPTTVHLFQARFRFNFFDGTLDHAHLTNMETGQRIDLLFGVGQTRFGGPSSFEPLSAIEKIPSGVWVQTQGWFDSPLDETDFLQRFGNFRLTFKVKGRIERHIYFRPSENAVYLKRWHAMLDNQEQHVGIVLKS